MSLIDFLLSISIHTLNLLRNTRNRRHLTLQTTNIISTTMLIPTERRLRIHRIPTTIPIEIVLDTLLLLTVPPITTITMHVPHRTIPTSSRILRKTPIHSVQSKLRTSILINNPIRLTRRLVIRRVLSIRRISPISLRLLTKPHQILHIITLSNISLPPPLINTRQLRTRSKRRQIRLSILIRLRHIRTRHTILISRIVTSRLRIRVINLTPTIHPTSHQRRLSPPRTSLHKLLLINRLIHLRHRPTNHQILIIENQPSRMLRNPILQLTLIKRLSRLLKIPLKHITSLHNLIPVIRRLLRIHRRNLHRISRLIKPKRQQHLPITVRNFLNTIRQLHHRRRKRRNLSARDTLLRLGCIFVVQVIFGKLTGFRVRVLLRVHPMERPAGHAIALSQLRGQIKFVRIEHLKELVVTNLRLGFCLSPQICGRHIFKVRSLLSAAALLLSLALRYLTMNINMKLTSRRHNLPSK